MQHQVVLQADGEAEREREYSRHFFAHHHPVAVVVLTRATEALVDLQRIDTGFGRASEHRAVDHVLPVPIMLMGNDFTRQEFPDGLAVRLVVGPVQRSLHRLKPFDDGDVGLPAAFTHGLQPVPAPGTLQFVQQRGHQPSAGAADRMAEGDGSAVGVDPLRSASSSASHASTTGANASLISMASKSSIDMPVRFSACWVAGIGAVSIMTGSPPRTDMWWIRARGVRPNRSTAACDAMRRAAAPSEIWLATAAVRMPSSVRVGRVAIFFSDVSARGPSSAATPA